MVKNNLFNSFWKDSNEDIRGGSRTTATSKMERFMIIVNAFQSLTIITKRSILDIAAALDRPLDIGLWFEGFSENLFLSKSFVLATLRKSEKALDVLEISQKITSRHRTESKHCTLKIDSKVCLFHLLLKLQYVLI